MEIWVLRADWLGATRKVRTRNMGMKPAREIQYPRKERYEYTNKSEV